MEKSKMIAYRPAKDSEFLSSDGLFHGTVSLVLLEKQDKRNDGTLAYLFDITVNGATVGGIHLRLGWTLSYYYAGQIGYWIDEPHRKNGYATSACLALLPLVKAHGFKKIIIGTDEKNAASHRVCEKVGMNYIETLDTPEWSILYEEGQRRTSIYEWDIVNTDYNTYCTTDNKLTYAEYCELRSAVNWFAVSERQFEAGLGHTHYTAVIRDNGKAIGLVKGLGDTGYYWILTDLIVIPQYQGKGIGRQLVEGFLKHVDNILQYGENVFISLLSAKGKEEFYEKFGFIRRPCGEKYGAGMSIHYYKEKSHEII